MKHPRLQATLCSLGLLLTGLSQAFAEEARYHQLKMAEVDGRPHLLTRVKVEDTEAYLIVDTGATGEFVFDSDFVKELGRPLTPVGSGKTVAGRTKLYQTTFGSLDVGGAIRLKQHKCQVADLPAHLEMEGPDKELSTIGLIGSAFFTNARSVIDYGTRTILIPPNGTPPNAFKEQRIKEGDKDIPLHFDRRFRPFVTADIGGTTFSFLVDTAAGGDLLDESVAKQLGLELRETDGKVVGGGKGSHTRVRVTEVDELKIGPRIRLPELRFNVLPNSAGTTPPEGQPEYGGILGARVLEALKAKIDFHSKSLLVPPATAGAAEREPDGEATDDLIAKLFDCQPIRVGKRNELYIEATLNGEPTWLFMDSGADRMMLAKRFAESAKIPLKRSGTASGAGGGQEQQLYVGKLESLEIANRSYGSPSVYFVDLSAFPAPSFTPGEPSRPGLVGLDFFNGVPSAVDYANHRLILNSRQVEGGVSGVLQKQGQRSMRMIEAEGGRHYLIAGVGGREVLFLADTGASSCVIFEPAVEALGLEVEDSEHSVTTLGNKRKKRLATIHDLELGGEGIGGGVQMVVLPQGKEAKSIEGFPVYGILGGSLFDVVKATIDFESDRMSLP